MPTSYRAHHIHHVHQLLAPRLAFILFVAIGWLSIAIADKKGVPKPVQALADSAACADNCIGKVHIGNQTGLGMRKQPFLVFVSAMHRQIHRYWGDGFLAALESKQKDGFSDSLQMAIEISVAPNGKLESTVIVKPSGSLPFDVAALDSVISAAPFPPPPDAIKSADGNVYLTWHLHRDERQCHPSYVDMHILTTPPNQRNSPPPSPAATPSAALAATASKPATNVPDGAREATERWLSAYQKADPRWLAGASGLPFTAGGKQIADDGPALRRFFLEMLSAGTPARQRVTYYTPSQIQPRLGRLPRGGEEEDMFFAWVDRIGAPLILLLAPTDRGWSVVGLDH